MSVRMVEWGDGGARRWAGALSRAAIRASLLIALSSTVLLPISATAQSCTLESPGACSLTASASITVPAVVTVSLTPAPASPAATLADFEAGFGSVAGPTITVRANRPWALSIGAGSSLWLASNTVPGVSARTDKPAGDLLWSTDESTFAALGTAAQSLASGLATSGTSRALQYRVLYSLISDSPGRYEMAVLLTVTAP